MKIGVYGCGGFGHELIQPMRKLIASMESAPEMVFIDDHPQSAVLPVLQLSDMAQDDMYVLAVGDGKIREKIAAKCLRRGLIPFTLISKTSMIGVNNEIGEAAVICDFVSITANTKIGRHFQANIYSYVAHDCIIGDFVTFAPRVNCNGNVHIGNHAYVGTGATLRQGTLDKPLTIGEGATVGMGAVVTKDVAPGEVVVGNPAKLLKI